ncbi:hypothetical protein P9112_003602 [Eukaryota sp. TZLM1-RC]
MVTIIDTFTFAVGTIFVGLLIIIAISSLKHPHTAMRGLYGAIAAAILAVVWFSILFLTGVAWVFAFIPFIIGAVLGLLLARLVAMTSLPQMVALLNGLGGLAAVLLAFATFYEPGLATTLPLLLAIFLPLWIGTVTFFGSMIAVAKLIGRPKVLANDYPGPLRMFAFLLSFVALVPLLVLFLILATMASFLGLWILLAIAVVSAIMGVLFVIGIGGADMPVAISILNSLSGAAGTTAGFMVRNDLVVIIGAIVFASGAILAWLMARAMNRNLGRVLLGQWTGTAATSTKAEKTRTQEWKAEDVARALSQAKRVMIVPGYGLAVSRGQFACQELVEFLQSKGVKNTYVSHPVAGRMPGHMSVLLGEARVPWKQIQDVDDANREIEGVDVCVVVGANDTVNPAAIDDPQSPIAGMPIIEAHRAKRVVMIKRSLGFGYAKIDNPLWYRSNCYMMFSDAKQALEGIRDALPSDFKAGGAKHVVSEEVVDKEIVEEEEVLTWAGLDIDRRTKIFVPKEVFKDETRVALVPEHVKKLSKMGFMVYVEKGAGERAKFDDLAYLNSGAVIVDNFDEGVKLLKNEQDFVTVYEPVQEDETSSGHTESGEVYDDEDQEVDMLAP